jgi:hypothetical protein
MTLKQIKAAKILVGNGGNVTAAMIEAGYSPNTANTPGKLTKSKAWTELVEEILPDDKLLKTHLEALDATKYNDFSGEREPDHATRLKAVDLGYKVKHKTNETAILQQFNASEMKLEFVQDVESKTE